MTQSPHFRVAAWSCLLALTSSCQLFDTFDDELGERNTQPAVVYGGAPTDTVRLGLQWFNGCAILPNGAPVARGTLAIPYPEVCEGTFSSATLASPSPLPLLSGTKYFLGQIALTQTVKDQHTDASNLGPAIQWMRTASAFRGLDWSGVGIVSDEWGNGSDFNPQAFKRTVRFGGAAWMKNRQDDFRVELLSPDGDVVADQTYARSDFIAENPNAGHSVVSWEYDNVGPPQHPLDKTIHPVPPPAVPTGAPPGAQTQTTTIRIELWGSTNPRKMFQIPEGLTGDGAVRVTWSQLPSAPFYFPVHFTEPADLGEGCFAQDEPTRKVPCTFGLAPDVTFSPPANGAFYEPGESFRVTLAAKDANGNLLHPPDQLPSYNDTLAGKSNGLLYASLWALGTTQEKDSVALFAVSGPRHKMRPFYDVGTRPWHNTGEFLGQPKDNTEAAVLMPSILALLDLLPGASNAPFPSTLQLTVPKDAEPGTYNFVLKLHRQFYGERFTKAVPFYFQVGQKEETHFPGRVGNCQTCHRGVRSLDSIRHGLPVEFVEGCKTCHNRDDANAGREVQTYYLLHNLHMTSPKYPRQRNDCTFCHLTKESTLRPSYQACSACHPSIHPQEFGQLAISSDRDPSVSPTVHSECATACHGTSTPPSAHLLPSR